MALEEGDILLVTSLFLFLCYFVFKGYKNTQSVAVNEINLDDSEKQAGLKILHLSDLHLENISVTPEMITENVRNHDIDLIALTGDFLDRKRSIPKLIPYLEELKKLEPTHGIYAVFGNHDYVLSEPYFKQLKEVLKAHGIKTLQNKHETIEINGKRLNIIGIDDFSTSRSDVEKSYAGTAEGYNLVLTHDPNVVLAMQNYHFDYLLSGHFHGGQIHWPKPYHLLKMGKLVRMNMIKGLHRHNGRPFYISEGLGQTGVNIRIGSRPEITIHDIALKKESKSAAIAG